MKMNTTPSIETDYDNGLNFGDHLSVEFDLDDEPLTY